MCTCVYLWHVWLQVRVPFSPCLGVITVYITPLLKLLWPFIIDIMIKSKQLRHQTWLFLLLPIFLELSVLLLQSIPLLYAKFLIFLKLVIYSHTCVMGMLIPNSLPGSFYLPLKSHLKHHLFQEAMYNLLQVSYSRVLKSMGSRLNLPTFRP